MSGTTITSSSTAGYDLGATVSPPVTVAYGVTITSQSNPALGSAASDSTYWPITNYGTLLGQGTNSLSDGVLLAGGGGRSPTWQAG